MDITTATPVEIDTELKALYEASLEIGARLNRQAISMHYTAGDKKRYFGRRETWGMTFNEVIEVLRSRCADDEEKPWVARDAEKALDTYEALKEERRVNVEAQKGLNAEFVRRGGWTRAFLAVGQGMLHVHSSMDCSTCNKGLEPTRFDWRVEFSGKEEIDVVQAAGDRACTVCYPSAPVETLRRPTSIFSPEEVERQKAREERAAKKAAADALKVVVEDFPTRLIRPSRIEPMVKEFKSVRAAQQAAVTARYDALWHGRYEHLRHEVPQHEEIAESIERALAAKEGRPVEEVRAEISAKAQKKFAKGW